VDFEPLLLALFAANDAMLALLCWPALAVQSLAPGGPADPLAGGLGVWAGVPLTALWWAVLAVAAVRLPPPGR
jgi:hypothetical protein